MFALSSAHRVWHENRIRNFFAILPVIEDLIGFFKENAGFGFHVCL
jgi:hypothetical protein